MSDIFTAKKRMPYTKREYAMIFNEESSATYIVFSDIRPFTPQKSRKNFLNDWKTI